MTPLPCPQAALTEGLHNGEASRMEEQRQRLLAQFRKDEDEWNARSEAERARAESDLEALRLELEKAKHAHDLEIQHHKIHGESHKSQTALQMEARFEPAPRAAAAKAPFAPPACLALLSAVGGTTGHAHPTAAGRERSRAERP